MKFYVSWYHGDPLYQLYDDDCHMLVSPTSVSNIWTLERFPCLPREVMIDSGGFRYVTANNEEAPIAKELFERQLRMLDGADIPAILCSLDFPLISPDLSSNEKDRCIHLTIANAYEFKRLIEQNRLEKDLSFMAVIQGYDTASLRFCARELETIGFSLYGIGSLAGLLDHKEILARVKAAMSVVGSALHVFGVSAIRTTRALKRLGIRSMDSSRPAKAAAYNEVLYSRPFRRFGILDNGEPTGIIPRERCLAEPLPCDCPICQEDSTAILKVGKRKYIALRAVHNYFHMKCALLGTPIA